eukprot:TRINITY_DN39784_c0_g1_i1.p1 TRINITY_DN39784_c0_g1~~TRINITY_DN39784_c0_g1_i1.p1  ORF type:complete len:724 (-),score=57.67 TRINITY_DN39784_c0_g1_i1:547-2718(-)
MSVNVTDILIAYLPEWRRLMLTLNDVRESPALHAIINHVPQLRVALDEVSFPHASIDEGTYVSKGNPLCWSGGFNFDTCCNVPNGNSECWSDGYTWDTCCTGPPQRLDVPALACHELKSSPWSHFLDLLEKNGLECSECVSVASQLVREYEKVAPQTGDEVLLPEMRGGGKMWLPQSLEKYWDQFTSAVRACHFGYITALFVLSKSALKWGRNGEAKALLARADSSLSKSLYSALDFFESSPWGRVLRAVDIHEANLNVMASQYQRIQSPPPPLTTSPVFVMRERNRTASATLKLAVIGAHGSVMDPVFALVDASGSAVDVSLYGLFHPYGPEFVCREYRVACTSDDSFTWQTHVKLTNLLKTSGLAQLTSSSLLGASRKRFTELLAELESLLMPIFAAADVMICGVPYAPCSMLNKLASQMTSPHDAKPKLLLIQVLNSLTNVPHFARHAFLREIQGLAPESRHVISPNDAHFVHVQRSFTVKLFASSHFEVARMAALGVQVPFSKPSGLHLRTQSLRPQSHRVLLWQMGVWANPIGFFVMTKMIQALREAHPSFPFFFQLPPREVSQLESYADNAAILFFPWDFQGAVFQDLYNLPVPLLLPSPSWVHALAFRSLRDRLPMAWHGLRHDFNISSSYFDARANMPPFVSATVDGDAIRRIRYWYAATDYVRYPHINEFSSLPDLCGLLLRLDLEAVRARMFSYNEAARRASKMWFVDALSST